MRPRIFIPLLIIFILAISIVSEAASPLRKKNASPSAPQRIQIRGTPEGLVNITWEKPKKNDFSGFVVYRSTEEKKIGKIIARLRPEILAFYDNSITLGITHYYTVRSINKKGKESKNKKQMPYALPIISQWGTDKNTNPNYGTSNRFGSYPCEKQDVFKFTNSPVAMNDIKSILPPGSIGTGKGSYLKPGSFIFPNKDNTNVQVFAPANARLISGSFYKNSVTKSPEYQLSFQPDCNFKFTMGPLTSISDSLRSVFPDQPSEEWTNLNSFKTSVQVKSGEPIGILSNITPEIPGSTPPVALEFEFLKGDHKNELANPLRRTSGESSVRSVCPYDYFDETTKKQFYDKFASEKGDVLTPPKCSSASQDVPGTLRGEWFINKEPVQAFDTSELAITTSYGDNMIHIGVGYDYTEISRTNPTFKMPEEVTDQHCYVSDNNISDNNISTYFFKIISKTEMQLAVDKNSSQCPAEFPSASAVTYYR